MRLLLLLLLVVGLPGAEPSALFKRVLALQHVQEPELDDQAMITAFTALVESVRTALAGVQDVEARIALLNRMLLTERQVAYLSNQYWRDSTLAASLLRKQGNCLATSTLYVLVGEALDLPIRLVVIPRHAFVRWDDGMVRRNIETTDSGHEVSDHDYLYRRGDTDPADVEALGWGRSLDHHGFLAELVECAAQHRIGAADLAGALELLDEAERLMPDRSDRVLAHIHLRADLTKDRAAARIALARLLEHGNPPPSVATGALMELAMDAAGRGEPEQQRRLLLAAFARAPKSSMGNVLNALAFCYRTLRDTRSARRAMELSLALIPPGSPDLAGGLYNLAILQKNDHDLEAAIATIRQGLRLNPESWNLQMLLAGYLMQSGQREEAARIRAQVVPPRAAAEWWSCMEAWYLAVSGEREAFFTKLTAALEAANSLYLLQWLDQDEDLDPYRSDPQFIDLVRIHRERLGAAKPAAVPAP